MIAIDTCLDGPQTMKHTMIGLASGGLLLLWATANASSQSRLDAELDVKALCTSIEERYVYFGQRASYWEEACAQASEDAQAAVSVGEALGILERLIDDLYDPHVSLNANTSSSPRLVPSGSDMWVIRNGDTYTVDAVRRDSGAANGGVRRGDQVLSFNGMRPDDLALTRIHTGRDAISDERFVWALNAALAGRRDQPRTLRVLRGTQQLSFDLKEPSPERSDTALLSTRLEGNIGYMRFANSLGHDETVPAFDRALAELRGTRALILDLRDTPSGGNTGVAEPILGRFVEQAGPYQVTRYPGDEGFSRSVTPRGPWTYKKPMVVLVGRWTGSMGEGMAIGLDALGRADVIGTRMAGLAGGTEAARLEETGLSLFFPTYDLLHVDGTQRHRWSPQQRFRVPSDNGNERDLTLAKAQDLLAQ